MNHFHRLSWSIVIGLAVVAGVVAVTDVGRPSWATASRQPALVSDQAASRLAPSGFDQAQGAR